MAESPRGTAEAPPAAYDSEFEPVLTRLGQRVAGRYHTRPESLGDKYELTDTVLGSGANGNVHLALSKSDASKTFAVKTVLFSGVAGFDEWKMLERQLEVALFVDSPHLVGVTDVYETDEAVHFVMPHMQGGALIQDELAPRVSEDAGRDAARQMLLALRYLHGHGIVHRDVKPSNCVMEQKHGTILKMLDFDLCTFWKVGDPKMRSGCGTPGFMSPELRLGRGYTSQTDMWSLGVTLFRLLVGEMPFPDDDVPDQEHVNRLLASSVTTVLGPDALHLITSLLRADPASRPTAEEALRLPFLAPPRAPRPAAPLCSAGRRQRQRPRRCGRAGHAGEALGGCGGRRKASRCGADIAAKPEFVKNLATYDERPSLVVPAAPPQQKARWADLEDDGDVSDMFQAGRKAAAVRWADVEDDDDVLGIF